uniref:Uncharacterized protein n=1 Tax=Pithovirus LCPAC406 TaxID=2506599 RepID=A0A481ZCU1_9VIRU|nr:MAG: uncharacterized protein LCPAC406_00480 [Pithovirus LCPAC406]
MSGFYKMFIEWVNSFCPAKKEIPDPIRIGQHQIIYYEIANKIYSVITEYDESLIPETIGGAKKVYSFSKGREIEITNQPGILYPKIVPSELGTCVKMVNLIDNTTTTFYGDDDVSPYLNGIIPPYNDEFTHISDNDP